MRDDWQAGKAERNCRGDLAKQRCADYVLIADAVDVCSANWAFGVDASGPLIDHLAERIKANNRQLKNSITLGRKASCLNVDNSE